MKIKLIAGACLALCSAASFATGVACVSTATPASASTTVNKKTVAAVPAYTAQQNFVNTCLTPTSVFYIAGSSALASAVGNVVPTDILSTATGAPIISIQDIGSPNGNKSSAAIAGVGNGGVSAWAGYATGTTTPILVIYNSNNGSAAGISQLLDAVPKNSAAAAAAGSVPEFDVVTAGVGSVTKGLAGTCAPVTTDATGNTIACTSHAPTAATVGIADVRPIELFELEGSAAIASTTTLTVTPVAIQGMGIAVNSNLYAALQTAEGLTSTQQPSIDKAVYTSLVSKTGAIKSSAALLNAVLNTAAGGTLPSTTPMLELARRDNFSGTQAASNIFFLGNACDYTSTTKGTVTTLNKGTLGGGLVPTDTSDSVTGTLLVDANATTGNVTGALASTTNYVIGVLTLNKADSAIGGNAHFVKLNGVSPTFEADGVTVADHQRTRFASGDYPFAVESTVSVVTKTPKTNYFPSLVTPLIAALSNSNLHNIEGLGYIDGAVASQQSHVAPAGGNNCSPLSHL
jgi:hypothetical protein